MELRDIKGIGPKRLALLSELNIHTVEDLLHTYPREYLDYTLTTGLKDTSENERVSVRVTALADPTVFYHKGKYIVSLRVSDATGKATFRWMNQPYRLNQFHAGDELYANGIVSKKRGTVLYNPQITRAGGEIVPVYATVKGLTQNVIRDAIAEILERTAVQDILPDAWRSKYRLTTYRNALQEIHFPQSAASLREAKRRISFEETVMYFTAIRAAKADRERNNGYRFQTDDLLPSFLKSLRFEPTEAQLRAMREIEADMHSDHPMNRLVQGDVGSGKTLVAEYAMHICASNGKQAILLAPTELLAEQHLNTLKQRFPNACLYIGSLSKKEKEQLQNEIANGTRAIVIGTHALLSDSVRFSDLGLVVTDEQHRFGVLQRAKIQSKGIRPDVLVMSATPIPRTLTLLLYADLDLSVIDMLPPGRKTIKTYYVPQSRRHDLYQHLAKAAELGERAYVVCPLIEPTEGYEGLSLEELTEEIGSMLPECRIGCLHGQMPDKEKRRIMDAFRTGEISILISTTVVEVGVDVPEATAMVIEGADHFGLATLHQLRGRVGRGEKASSCYLLAAKASDHAKQRIETMIESSDGFVIAQKDLEMRGSGDLFGVRQSGDGQINGILYNSTVEIVEAAATAANEIYELPTVQYNMLLEEAQKRYGTVNQIAHN